MDLALTFLVFVFGYLTCKVFYYFRAARLSVALMRLGNLYSLYLLTRALENFEHSKHTCLNDLKKSETSERNIKIYETNLDAEIETFKRKSIEALMDAHPQFFERTLAYEDWESAMKFLEQNKDLIISGYLK